MLCQGELLRNGRVVGQDMFALAAHAMLYEGLRCMNGLYARAGLYERAVCTGWAV